MVLKKIHTSAVRQTTDVLDIIVHTNFKWSFTTEVCPELSSDYLPFILELNTRGKNKQEEIKVINSLEY